MIVGARYILFLNSLDTPERRIDGGSRVMYGEHSGLQAFLDEYMVTHPTRGKIRLERGVTQLPHDGDVMVPPWKFEEEGLSLIGRREAEVEELIGQAVAAGRR